MHAKGEANSLINVYLFIPSIIYFCCISWKYIPAACIICRGESRQGREEVGNEASCLADCLINQRGYWFSWPLLLSCLLLSDWLRPTIPLKEMTQMSSPHKRRLRLRHRCSFCARSLPQTACFLFKAPTMFQHPVLHFNESKPSRLQGFYWTQVHASKQLESDRTFKTSSLPARLLRFSLPSYLRLCWGVVTPSGPEQTT